MDWISDSASHFWNFHHAGTFFCSVFVVVGCVWRWWCCLVGLLFLSLLLFISFLVFLWMRSVHFSPQKQILPYCVCGIIFYIFFCFSPFVRSYSFNLFVLFGVICCCCIYGFVQKKETSDWTFLASKLTKRGSQIRWFKRKTRKCFASMEIEKGKNISSALYIPILLHICKRTTESLHTFFSLSLSLRCSVVAAAAGAIFFSIEHISFSPILYSCLVLFLNRDFVTRCVFVCLLAQKLKEAKNLCPFSIGGKKIPFEKS